MSQFCPSCSEPFNENDAYCQECGHQLDKSGGGTNKSSEPNTEKNEIKIECANCKESIHIDARECPYCGSLNHSSKINIFFWFIGGALLSIVAYRLGFRNLASDLLPSNLSSTWQELSLGEFVVETLIIILLLGGPLFILISVINWGARKQMIAENKKQANEKSKSQVEITQEKLTSSEEPQPKESQHSEPHQKKDYVANITAQASGSTVTEEILSKKGEASLRSPAYLSDAPLINYLKSNETVEYILWNYKKGINISSQGKFNPDVDYRAMIAFTNNRILIIVGKDDGDIEFSFYFEDIERISGSCGIIKDKIKITTSDDEIEFYTAIDAVENDDEFNNVVEYVGDKTPSLG